MNKHFITVSSGNIHDPVMEEMMLKGDTRIKDLARINAKHFARRNLPAAKGDNLSHYTDEIRSAYEKLASDVYGHLQPAAHYPESKMDADFFKEKVAKIEAGIKEKEAQNQNDEYELTDFDQGSIPKHIRYAIYSTAVITVGEIMFNTRAFQVTGETMLFSFILSLCISFAVFIFSHITPLLYKNAKNTLQRSSVIIVSLLLATSIFTALARFRSSYLASHDVHIRPFYFVVINLFFFVVSALLSFFVLPSWAEIKENSRRLKIFQDLKKRLREIEKLKLEVEKIKETILERTKFRIRITYHANYATERIRKMYWQSIGIFKTTNLTYRTDGQTPDCFCEVLPEADIEKNNITILTNND